MPATQLANGNIEVQYAQSADFSSQMEHIPDEATFQKWILAALAGNDIKGSICLRIVDGEEMIALNGQYRGQYVATNVLSFSADAGMLHAIDPMLGDIAICAEVVSNQAGEQNKTVKNHWAHMTVHGVLHLLGYDHQTNTDALRMESLEVEILSKLNVPDPYNV